MSQERSGRMIDKVRIQFPDQHFLLIRGKESGLKAVARQLIQIIASQIQCFLNSDVILIHIPAKISRIIRIDRHTQPPVQQLFNAVVFHPLKDAQFGIGKRTNCQRYTHFCQAGQQGFIFNAASRRGQSARRPDHPTLPRYTPADLLRRHGPQAGSPTHALSDTPAENSSGGWPTSDESSPTAVQSTA